MTPEPSSGEIGRARRRVEDDRLLRGTGCFADDLAPDALAAAFVRSPFAHARVGRIDAARAAAAPGVVAVFTARDMPQPAADVASLPFEFRAAPAPILAAEVAHHVGFAVALVVAETAAQAADAAGLVEVSWEELPAVAGVEAALADGAPVVHPELGTNLAFTARRGTPAAEMDALFAGASRVVRRRLVVPRVAGVPLQPLAFVAAPGPGGEGLTVWCTTQAHWRVRAVLARVLEIDEARVRVVAPDVGGGFGVRAPVYPEYLALAWAARRLGRAVRWSASRSEDMLVTRASRDVVAEAEIAGDADGRVLALRARVLLNLGAYADALGFAVRILACMAGPYRFRGVGVELSGVYTHTTSAGAYRGAGRPEAAYVVERLVDALAVEAGLDPVELRLRSFVPPDAFPYRTPLGTTYDSGAYGRALERAAEVVGYRALRTRQAELVRAGARRLIGVGIASYVEPSGAGWESGHVRVEPSGRVSARSGLAAQGQGHATTFAQIVAERLRVPFEHVTVQQGDTATGPPGSGTFNSRSTALGGGALDEACRRVVAKARVIAGHLLGANPDELTHTPEGFAPGDEPSRLVPWARVAHAAYAGSLPPGEEPGLEATSYFRLADEPWSFGACIAQVAVDRETGEVTVERLVSVDDCGTVVNPLLLRGQSHGGLAQGIGAALCEWMRYAPDGQPLTTTLMDYAVPLARDLPRFEVEQTETPSPLGPLGVKGHGEAGAMAAPPAVVGAVLDALAPLGVRTIDPPLTPNRVWAAIRAASGR